jgi:hypothetical protein
MKKLLLLLLITTFSYAQDTTIHFYGSTKLTTGAEILFSNYGFGFSGAWNVKETLPSDINDYDKTQTVTSEIREEWCSLYLVASIGNFHDVLIKARGGLAVYNDKVTFNDDYTKIDQVTYRPLIGISAMYPITEDIGIEAGFDTFNYGTVGFTILF